MSLPTTRCERLARQAGRDAGFEAALFMPLGTQSNLCAILAHCGRGDEYIVGSWRTPIGTKGGGAAAVLGSVQPQPLAQDAAGQNVIS